MSNAARDEASRCQRRSVTWTCVGDSGQLPREKPSVEMNTARSDTLPNVALKELSLLHIVPEAARYEMVSVPQKVASVDG